MAKNVNMVEVIRFARENQLDISSPESRELARVMFLKSLGQSDASDDASETTPTEYLVTVLNPVTRAVVFAGKAFSSGQRGRRPSDRSKWSALDHLVEAAEYKQAEIEIDSGVPGIVLKARVEDLSAQSLATLLA